MKKLTHTRYFPEDEDNFRITPDREDFTVELSAVDFTNGIGLSIFFTPDHIPILERLINALEDLNGND